VTFAEVTIGELEAQGCILDIQDGNHGEKHPKANEYVPESYRRILVTEGIRRQRLELAI
jgi:type I restriction enzyme, S subunit